jgi:uncharacterized MAPEG superfamily protein
VTIAYWTVLAAAILPIVWAGVAKVGGRDYDNRNPRAWLANLKGPRMRAHAAQQNAHEAFPPFAAAVIIAHQFAVGQGLIDSLALLWLGLRCAHGGFYIADLHWLRSLVWCAAMVCVVALFVAAAR